MVIAVAAFGLALHPERQEVGTGIGSAAPTPRRAAGGRGVPGRRAGRRGPVGVARPTCPRTIVTEFGALVRAAAAPIDDVRGTASYRLHALDVMARRTLTWAWREYREGRGTAAAAGG